MTVITAIGRLIEFGGVLFPLAAGLRRSIPGAYRIPYLTSIPILADLTAGRVHTHAARQVKLATADMVTKFERDAVQAQLDEERRRRAISDAAAAQAQERADATELARQAAEAKIDQLEAQARKDASTPGAKEICDGTSVIDLADAAGRLPERSGARGQGGSDEGAGAGLDTVP